MQTDTYKYLTRNRALLEMGMSIFALWWGWNVLASALSGHDPIWWIVAGPFWSVAFPSAFIVMGLLHGVGIWVNGAWKWSPVLRIVALTGMALLFGCMMVKAQQSTAFPTYSALVVIYGYVLIGAVKDLSFSLRSAAHAGDR